jgi:uncharacterized membrane protein YidH (DUF202 family)
MAALLQPARLIAVLLIVAGLAALAYGKFSFTEGSHTARVGDLAVTVREQRTVNIPFWLGAGAVVAGALVLFAAGSEKRP